MGYTVEQLPNEPILIGIFYPPLDALKDAAEGIRKLDQLIQSIEGMVYYVSDRTRIDLTLTDLIQGLSAARSYFRPDKVTYIQVIDRLSAITQGTLKLEAFGGFDLILVTSIEEGIRYARTQIAGEKDEPPTP